MQKIHIYKVKRVSHCGIDFSDRSALEIRELMTCHVARATCISCLMMKTKDLQKQSYECSIKFLELCLEQNNIENNEFTHRISVPLHANTSEQCLQLSGKFINLSDKEFIPPHNNECHCVLKKIGEYNA